MDWDVDPMVLSRFVALKVLRTEVVNQGLDKVVPVPHGRTTFHSFANPKDNAKRTGGDNQFRPVVDKPTTTQDRHLLGLAANTTIHQCMDSHYYRIGEEIRKQGDGGSIGTALSGEASRVYMLKWDYLFLGRLTTLGITIHMYVRYVDDITILVDNILHCWDYDPTQGVMVHNSDLCGDTGLNTTSEAHTFKVLQAIANSIHSQIQLCLETMKMASSLC
jgi:hypothetical protein